MITKHTHGPWSVAHRAKGLAINGPRSQVAVIGFLDEQAQADAALIAAAPDLLWCLVQIQSGESMTVEMQLAIDSAIRRATGAAS
jgi:hypothetical protein